MYSKKTFPYIGLAILATTSMLHADPFVLTPTGPVPEPTALFVPPVYNPGNPPMFPPSSMPGQHNNAVIFSMPETIASSGSGSFTWEYISDGVYTVSSASEYSSAYLSFTLGYLGAVRDSDSQLSVFATPTLELIGLEGIAAQDLNIFATAGNAGFQFMYSASITLVADTSFSFTGFRLTSMLGPGDHDLSFNEFISASMGFSGSTSSQTDPGGGLAFQAVPEPSSLLLFAAAGLGGYVWRRRSRLKSHTLKG